MGPMHNPAHPGEILREYLPGNVGVSEAAKRLGITRQALSAVLNGRAGVSAAMAVRLEIALGASAEMWLTMQAAWDLWQERQKKPPKVMRIVARKAA
jgi:addiction module HigA family antidote